MASCKVQPVIASATGFMKVTPPASVVKTASPMEYRVTCRRSFSSCGVSARVRISVMSLLMPIIRTGRLSSSRVSVAIARRWRTSRLGRTIRNSQSNFCNPLTARSSSRSTRS